MNPKEQRSLFRFLYGLTELSAPPHPEAIQLIETFPDFKILSPALKTAVKKDREKLPSLEVSLKAVARFPKVLQFRALFYGLRVLHHSNPNPDSQSETVQQDTLSQLEKALKIAPQQMAALHRVVGILEDLEPSTASGEMDQTQIQKLQQVPQDLEQNSIPFKAIQPAFPEAIARHLYYSDPLFWGKLKGLGGKVGRNLLENALVLFYAAHHPDTPKQAKMVIYGALAYFILPTDLIPDFLPMVGLSDDLVVLASALTTVARNITPEIRERARQQTYQWLQRWL